MIPDYLSKEIKKLIKDVICCRAGEILEAEGITAGQPAGRYKLGVIPSSGEVYTVDSDGNWVLFTGGGGGGGSQNLQQVTDLGSTTTNPIIIRDDQNQTYITYDNKKIRLDDGDSGTILEFIGTTGQFNFLHTPKYNFSQNPNGDPRVLVQTVNNIEADAFGNVNISGGGGAYIPLAGTDSGSPVTGDIELYVPDDEHSRSIYWISDTNIGTQQFTSLSWSVILSDIASGLQTSLGVDSNQAFITSSDPTCQGIQGNSDFSPNYDDLSYVQKGYVDTQIGTTKFGVGDNNSAEDRDFDLHGNVFNIHGTKANFLLGDSSNNLASRSADGLTTNDLIQTPTLTTSNKDIEITDLTQGIILKSPNGTRFRIQVSNSGALTTTSL